MGAIVTFDYVSWSARYPELATSVNAAQAQEYFNEATIYQRNDGGGPVNNSTVQSTLLNMLTAHIAALYAVLNGQASPTIVGRISNAAEGSVSVQTDYGATISQQMAWAIQTKYGASWWAASAPYRTMRYLPNPQRVVNGAYPWGRC